MLLQEIAENQLNSEVFKDKSNPINNSLQWQQMVKLLNKMFWTWYEDQRFDMERPIVTIKKWGIISFTVRVKHLESILTWIVGAPA